MTTLHALLIGGGVLLIVAAVVMVRRSTPSTIPVAIIAALIASGSSAAFALERTPGMKAIDIAANTIVHLGAISVVVAAIPWRKARSPKMRSRMLTILRLGVGIALLLLGIVGSFLPVLQGWLFFLLAFLVLFPRTRFTEKILSRTERKLPRVVRFLRRLGIGEERAQSG